MLYILQGNVNVGQSDTNFEETKTMTEFGKVCREAKEAAIVRRNDALKDVYDNNPDMLLSELAQIAGVSVTELKQILMGGEL